MLLINDKKVPVAKTEKLSAVLKQHGVKIADAKVRVDTVSYSVKSLDRFYVRADKDTVVETDPANSEADK